MPDYSKLQEEPKKIMVKGKYLQLIQYEKEFEEEIELEQAEEEEKEKQEEGNQDDQNLIPDEKNSH